MRRSLSRSTCRAPVLARAQHGRSHDAGPPLATAAADQQQQRVAAANVAETFTEEEQRFEEFASSAADDAYNAALAEEQLAAASQAVPAPTPKAGGGLPLGPYLQHPAVRIGGILAGVFLGGTLLITLWRMARDPQRKRSKTINKNKLVVDTISKYLPGRRSDLSATSVGLLKLQTGFSAVEVFRKYLWFLLRERQFDEEAVADLVALKAALGLTDEQVADALRERAERVYEKYGTVMVNTEGLSQAGIERKATARNLFMKLLSLSEARPLLGAEAADKVDLGKVFGVTQRDVLTLRSGYSAEAEGAALERDEGEGGDE